MEYRFYLMLVIMSILAVVVFVALNFVDAGYGMMINKRWGKTVCNKAGWVIMESPVFVAMIALWLLSERTWQPVPLIFFIFFEIHYFQRSFIFPSLMKGSNRMPILIIFLGVVFNLTNALMQGGWIFFISPADMYTVKWLWSWQFILGTVLFFAGMYINMQSDRIIRSLRRGNDHKHYIPYGGMFRYVSSANYFGEFIEWVGFAVLTWSLSGAVFALWTFANLAPRAVSIRRRYEQEFGEEFTRLHRKSILPFVY